MECETLVFSKEGLVAVITLRGPIENMHELAQLSAELSECCQRFRESTESRVLVLTGETPEAFCMGKCLLAVREEGTQLFSIAQPFAVLQRPVLVAITGSALGLGLELALACDVRIASKDALFGMPHVKGGIIPWDGGTQRLVRTVGKGKALEMILTGEPIDAQEANEIGLISHLVFAGEEISTVMKMAHEMARKSPISLEYCKEAIYKGMDLTLEQGLHLEANLYFLMHTTKDREEGIKAFKEKRKPEFKGI